MADSSKPGTGYEIPPEMREFAERSVEQARKAVDGFLGAAQKTVDTFDNAGATVQGGAKDLTRKTFGYAEKNIAAAFDLAQKLVRAKDPQEAMRLQAEYVREQFAELQTQVKEFGAAAQGAVTHGLGQQAQAPRQGGGTRK